MSFDLNLPFVETVYDFVESGELEKCEIYLKKLIGNQQDSELHCVLDYTFEPLVPDYSEWLFTGCSNEDEIDTSKAIITSMGEFEINYHDWTADAAICDNFDNPDDKFEWICESGARSLCDWYHFSSVSPLSGAFALADESEHSDCPIAPETFTAACYLVFTYFLKLNRDVHHLAVENGMTMSKAHLFCHYGDCLFHSPPKTERSTNS